MSLFLHSPRSRLLRGPCRGDGVEGMGWDGMNERMEELEEKTGGGLGL